MDLHSVVGFLKKISALHFLIRSLSFNVSPGIGNHDIV